MAAIRDKEWKLLEFKHTNVYELYNVGIDSTESINVSEEYPEELKNLKDALFSYRSVSGVSHRASNEYRELNEKLYQKITPNILTENYGPSTPEGNQIVFNAGFEYWYNLDWNLRVNKEVEAIFEKSESTHGGESAGLIKISQNRGDNVQLNDVVLENTSNYNDFSGAEIEVGACMKSSSLIKVKFQISVVLEEKNRKGRNIIKNYFAMPEASGNENNEGVFQIIDDNFRLYKGRVKLDENSTKSVTVKLLCGKDEGEIYVDDFFANIYDGNLSTQIIDDFSVVITPNPVKDVLYIKSPNSIKKILVFDQTNKLVQTINDFYSHRSIRNLITGVYIVKIFFHNNTHIVKRIIKS